MLLQFIARVSSILEALSPALFSSLSPPEAESSASLFLVFGPSPSRPKEIYEVIVPSHVPCGAKMVQQDDYGGSNGRQQQQDAAAAAVASCQQEVQKPFLSAATVAPQPLLVSATSHAAPADHSAAAAASSSRPYKDSCRRMLQALLLKHEHVKPWAHHLSK